MLEGERYIEALEMEFALLDDCPRRNEIGRVLAPWRFFKVCDLKHGWSKMELPDEK